MKERIEFKLCLLIFKAVNGVAPAYLCDLDLLVRVAEELPPYTYLLGLQDRTQERFRLLLRKFGTNYSKTPIYRAPIYRAPIYRKPRYTAAISFIQIGLNIHNVN